MSEKLSFPPLHYSMIQVIFNKILLMEKFIPEVQEEMRKCGFPDFFSEQRINVAFEGIGTQQSKIDTQNVWSFTDMDKRNGFILTSSSLIHHTTDYNTFESFKNYMSKGLKLLHDIVQLDYIQRVGMRYINIISPTNTEPLSHFLVKGVSGLLDNVEKGFLSFDGASAQEIENGILVVKISVRPNISSPIMPSDLLPLRLLATNKTFNNESLTRALLDLDFYTVERFVFDVIKLEEKFNSAHEQIERAFFLAVTKVALDKWR